MKVGEITVEERREGGRGAVPKVQDKTPNERKRKQNGDERKCELEENKDNKINKYNKRDKEIRINRE